MNWTECQRKRQERKDTYLSLEAKITQSSPITGLKPVLIACECSQIETLTFRAHGIEAYSCDILPCAGTHPEWHYQCDALELLQPGRWGLIIAHPPCTYLTAAGGRYVNDPGRAEKRALAAQFFYQFYEYQDCPMAIENPRPLHAAQLPRYDQVISPHHFGSQWSKRTCLWLKDLPPLLPNCAATLHPKSWTASTRGGHLRSITFPELAEAYAVQWARYILAAQLDA